MEKKEFIEAHENIAASLVEEAWEQAEGEAEKAAELLQPQLLVFQGKLISSGQEPEGLFQLIWDLNEQEMTDAYGVMAGHISVGDVNPEMEYQLFKSKITELLESSQKMGLHTEELNQLIQAELKKPAQEFLELVEESSLDEAVNFLEEIFQEKFDCRKEEITIVPRLLRALQVEKENEEDDEEQEINFSCLPSVNPVKGVSLDRLSVGDKIFVEINDTASSPQEQKVLSVMEKFRDEKTGLLPAEIYNFEDQAGGELQIEIQFGKNVTGTLTCGSNVNLLCPEETTTKKNPTGVSLEHLDFEELLLKFWFIPIIIGLIILILVLI